MPRSKSYSTEDLVRKALDHFWRCGFGATSMDDLVTATHVSRHGIYSAFGGKHDLFLACMAAYQREVVTPAFSRVEASSATIDDIAAYYEHQIVLAEQSGLPGPGCLVANTLTEYAPHSPDIMKAVQVHQDRLREGFRNALSNTTPNAESLLLDDLASFLVVATTGLWSLSRSIATGDELRSYMVTIMALIKGRVLS